MRLFVTGGSGFLGSHFVKQALAAGHEVTALRRTQSSRSRIQIAKEPVWLDKDLSEVARDDLACHDILVHLVAVGVNPQKADLATLFRVNVTESYAFWLRAADAHIRRFVICGSCLEYGRSGQRYDRIPVTAPLEPTHAYAASKAAATMNALAVSAECNVELIVLRPFHIFGEGQHPDNFWPALRRAALGGEDFAMTPGEQVRDFMPVEQVAAAFLAGVTRGDLTPGLPIVENLGTGQPQTLRAFAEYWWKVWNAKGKLQVGAKPYSSGEVMRYVPQLPP